MRSAPRPSAKYSETDCDLRGSLQDIIWTGLPWADFEHELRSWFGHHLPGAFLSISGLPWAGSVQRGGFLFKEFWTCIVFWPDTCLVELTKSYVQVAKSYVQVAKFSSSVFL